MSQSAPGSKYNGLSAVLDQARAQVALLQQADETIRALIEKRRRLSSDLDAVKNQLNAEMQHLMTPPYEREAEEKPETKASAAPQLSEEPHLNAPRMMSRSVA